jgi:hypothetical protein
LDSAKHNIFFCPLEEFFLRLLGNLVSTSHCFVLFGFVSASKWSNVTFRLRNTSRAIQWWELQSSQLKDGNPTPYSENLTITTFNERIAPGAFSFFTSYG